MRMPVNKGFAFIGTSPRLGFDAFYWAFLILPRKTATIAFFGFNDPFCHSNLQQGKTHGYSISTHRHPQADRGRSGGKVGHAQKADEPAPHGRSGEFPRQESEK